MFNTAQFSLIQVVLMVLFSLVDGAGAQPQDHRPRLLARRVLLSGAAVAGRRGADLEVAAADARASSMPAWSPRAPTPVNWLTDAHWAFFWTVFVSIWAHMGFYTLILLAGLQAIPREHVRGRRDGRRFAVANAAPHHAAAADAQPDRGAGAGDDPRGADLRRGVRAHRRRAGLGHHVHRAVHLPDRFRRADPPLRPGGGGLAGAGDRPDGADLRAAQADARRRRRARRRR